MNKLEYDLFKAIQDGNLAGVKKAIESGASSSSKDEQGYTPFRRAAQLHNKQICDLLISMGAEVD